MALNRSQLKWNCQWKTIFCSEIAPRLHWSCHWQAKSRRVSKWKFRPETALVLPLANEILLSILRSNFALKLLWSYHWKTNFYSRNCTFTALNPFWIYSWTALRLFWNCSETALKLLWNCSETALELLWSYHWKTNLCSRNCTFTALNLFWIYP